MIPGLLILATGVVSYCVWQDRRNREAVDLAWRRHVAENLHPSRIVNHFAEWESEQAAWWENGCSDKGSRGALYDQQAQK